MDSLARTKVSSMMRKVYANKLTTTTGGNISIRNKDNMIYITPSGNDKSVVCSSEIAVIDGENILGDQKPSSEYPFHCGIYRSNEKINAIIHAHPKGIVGFSAVRKLPNTDIMYKYENLNIRSSFAKYALPGSEKLAKNIADEFAKGSNAVFLENHGIVIGTSSLEKAYKILERLEACCLLEINARTLNKSFSEPKPKVCVSPLEIWNSETLTKQTLQIEKVSKRMADTGLVLANMAVISERIKNQTFAITQEKTALSEITHEDIVFVDELAHNSKLFNQPLASLVKSIYESDEAINAVIIASPINAMGFSLADAQIDTKIIPEGYILLRDIPTVEKLDIESIVQSLSKKTPLVNVSGNFYISIGKNLLQAYDRLEVLEFGASSLMYARQFEQIYSISDSEIDDINLKFSGW